MLSPGGNVGDGHVTGVALSTPVSAPVGAESVPPSVPGMRVIASRSAREHAADSQRHSGERETGRGHRNGLTATLRSSA